VAISVETVIGRSAFTGESVTNLQGS